MASANGVRRSHVLQFTLGSKCASTEQDECKDDRALAKKDPMAVWIRRDMQGGHSRP